MKKMIALLLAAVLAVMLMACGKVTVHCDGCGKLVDITFGGLKELLENKGEIAVNDYQLNIRGLCPACNTKQKKIRVQ